MPRLLQNIHAANPRYGPVYLAKIDIADGFYCLGLRPSDAVKLAILFPTRPGEEQLIGIPLTLPMGWAESPPVFCTVTETVANLANTMLAGHLDSELKLPHRLDKMAETTPTLTPNDRVSGGDVNTPAVPAGHAEGPKFQRPLWYFDVYVDNFLGLAQGGKRT